MKPVLLAAIAAVVAAPAIWDYSALRDRVATVTELVVTHETAPPVRAQIEHMMTEAAGAWNRGDLDRFVADYAPDTTTTFIGSRGIMRGRAAIRAAYAPRFSAPGKQDSLSFENIEVDSLAPDALNVIAYYRLSRGDSTIARGPTSLVMRKIGGVWKIVHDHSS